MKRTFLIALATAALMGLLYASIVYLSPATPLIVLVGLGIAAIVYDARLVSGAIPQPKTTTQGDNK